MRNLFLTALLIVGFGATAIFGKNAKGNTVLLKIDYKGIPSCNYSAEYSSKGTFKQKDSVSTKSTRVLAALSFANKEKNLAVKVDSMSVTSDFLKPEQQTEIVQKCLKNEYTLSLSHGFPSLDSSAVIPIERYLEWDLIRQIAKLLPLLPNKPVHAGFTWERTMTLPLQTAAGKTSCEIYRFYTLDKVQGDTASISWKLNYTASKKARDTMELLRNIPVAGKGSGAAVLDLRNHCIIGADMDFTTPIGTVGDISVSWTEKASIRLKSGK
jgi:hypothetical protein